MKNPDSSVSSKDAPSFDKDEPSFDKDAPSFDKDALKKQIVEALKKVYDPEIPVNIYDLGLIYHIEIEDDHSVLVDMTLTSPGCPVAQTFPAMVQAEVMCVEGVLKADVMLVWDPPWTPDRMTDAAKLELGML